MALCDDLAQQKSTLEANLAAVDAAIDQTTNAGELAALRRQQAQLRAQISHVDALIDQNCSGGTQLRGAAPPLASSDVRAVAVVRKEHHKALKTLTATTLSLSKAGLKAHRLPTAPKKKR